MSGGFVGIGFGIAGPGSAPVQPAAGLQTWLTLLGFPPLVVDAPLSTGLLSQEITALVLMRDLEAVTVRLQETETVTVSLQEAYTIRIFTQ